MIIFFHSVPKCQNVIESKAVNVGPFFHIVHLLNLKLHVTLSEKRWGFPSVYVCRINYNVTRGRHHNTIGCKFVYQMIVHYEKKFAKKLDLLIFCIHLLNFSLVFRITKIWVQFIKN